MMAELKQQQYEKDEQQQPQQQPQQHHPQLIPTAKMSKTSSSTKLQQLPTSVVDYIICSEFDESHGPSITKQLPANLPLVSYQMDSLMDIILPLNLHKFLNKEHYTLIPLFIDISTGLLSSSKDSKHHEPCYLYTISYFQNDNSSRNGTAKSISIITRLPFFEVLKPLMYFILRDQFNNNSLDDFKTIGSVFLNLNNSGLDKLYSYFSKLTAASRFVLARVSKETTQQSLELPKDLSRYFVDSDYLYKTSIDLGSFKFPIQIPKVSLLNSRLCMFGLDLQKDSYLRKFLLCLKSTKIEYLNPNSGSTSNSDPISFEETCLTPYSKIDALHILINAMILKKKIILYAYETCYNDLMDFSESLYLLFNNFESPIDFPFYPILGLGNLALLHNLKNYLIGTSSLLFREKLDWDLFYDFDNKKLLVNLKENEVDHEFFEDNNIDNINNSSNSSNLQEPNKRVSMMSLGLKQVLLKNQNLNISSFDVMTNSASINSSIASLSSVDSFHADDRLTSWEPSCFPRINENKIEKFLNTEKNPYFNQAEFQTKKLPNGNNLISRPMIDIKLDHQLHRLILEHHDDETIYVILTNYLRNLTTKVLPSFYHYLNFIKLSDYKYLVNYKIDEDVGDTTLNEFDLNFQMKNFIQSEKLIQAFPLNFPFNHDQAFLEDRKQIYFYAKIVLNNIQLLRLAVHYNDMVFKQKDLIPGFLFDWHNEDIRLDVHYLISILDRMIDNTSNESWKLNKFLILQIFKAINSILKKNPGHLSDLLVDFFIERKSNYSFLNLDNEKSSVTNNNHGFSGNLFNDANIHHDDDDDILRKLRNLNVEGVNLDITREIIKLETKSETDNDIEDSLHTINIDLIAKCGELGLKRFNKLLLVASLYLSLRGPIDIVETKSGARKKDLLLTEFKRFLSSVLNNPFFKNFMLPHIDDFMKLTINDFIDYHM